MYWWDGQEMWWVELDGWDVILSPFSDFLICLLEPGFEYLICALF